MKTGHRYKPATLAVHTASAADEKIRPLCTPIYQTATFHLSEKVYTAMKGDRGRDGYIYTRYANPTQNAVAARIAALEGAEDGLVFSSGMAAISSSLLAFLQPGDHLAYARDLYGGTLSFVQKHLQTLGIKTSAFETEEADSLRKVLRAETRVVFFETITNPLLKVADIAELTQIAHEAKALVLVDSTFATPVNCRPLNWGADLVIHSGSKYLNGHSDLICGAVAGSRPLTDRVWKNLQAYGGCLDPTAAYHLERGLKTVALRMERHNANAYVLAAFLEKHPLIEQVYYPLLASNPRKDIAAKYLEGGSGMVSIRIQGGDARALQMLDQLQLINVASSLGGVESLASMPMNTSHVQFSQQERARMGILPGTVRLSVGIEDADDLQQDLEDALQL